MSLSLIPFAVLLGLGSAESAFAMASDAGLCDLAADLAAQSSDTPFEVLQAIARVESGRLIQGETAPWPWAVNYAGKGYWFQSQTEAVDFANSLLAQGEDNFDLGCFQINQHWHGQKFTSVKDALSPRVNAAVAAAYLQSLFETSGSWGGAVAAYHSKTEAGGQEYLIKVEAMLQSLRGTDPAPLQPEPVAQTRPVNAFPLLRQGGTVTGASLVPLDGGGMSLFGTQP